MTMNPVLYLKVLKDYLSIGIDKEAGFYHQFKLDEIIPIYYSDMRYVVLLYGTEFKAEFIFDFNKTVSGSFDIFYSLKNGYLEDVTKCVKRNNLLEELGI